MKKTTVFYIAIILFSLVSGAALVKLLYGVQNKQTVYGPALIYIISIILFLAFLFYYKRKFSKK